MARVCGLLAVIVLFVESNAAAQSDSSREAGPSAAEIMAEMRAVWQARAERMGACRIECAETTSCCAFIAIVQSGNIEQFNALRDPNQLFQLMEPPLFDASTTLTVVAEGSRIRKVRSGERVIDEHGKLEPLHDVEVTDGNLFLTLDQSAEYYSIAEIRDGSPFMSRNPHRRGESWSWDINQIDMPVFSTMGLLFDRSRVFQDLEDWEVVFSTDECYSRLVTLSASENYQRHDFTFDRSRHFQLVNYSLFEGDFQQLSVDVRYSNLKAATTEWVPTGWSVTQREPEKNNILYRVNAEVTRFDVNVQTSPDEFDVSLPRASYVHDKRPTSAGYDEEWGSAAYFVNHDGSVRVLTGSRQLQHPRGYFD
jgi:hypothetical protein